MDILSIGLNLASASISDGLLTVNTQAIIDVDGDTIIDVDGNIVTEG